MSSTPENWQRAGFGLYLHWPFCQAKCPYCDFNSYVTKSVNEDDWAQAYLHEITRVGRETEGRVLSSIFFGGGTPSLMGGDLVRRILDKVRDTWTLANDAEITLEANPTSVEATRFTQYADAGVNRVSIGVQALNDPDLVRLGRLHSVSEALRAIETARTTFDRMSFDLIYARQDQSLDAWHTELAAALDFEPDHLSLYQLTIEDGTAFGDRAALGKLRGLPDDDLAADMYLSTQVMCSDAGLPAYEISNHARKDQQSRHNLIYWRGGDYVGIGPGAHGRVTNDGQRVATETALAPSAWLVAVNKAGTGEIRRDVLSDDSQTSEMLMMGLRLAEGVDAQRLDQVYINKINSLEYFQHIHDHVQLKPEFRPLLNAVLRELLV